ncbi:DUF305 domain-containing protein [Mobilicoccus caccae]|uniref:Lipoprotein n=2 Tax=Mobilicoccus caccae TaxID=1859295 RepID=A0ABQ6IJH8_9MICO|nr:DUF305 domain-containing protein [Mobilicoccus caccae]GMA38000.1 lipoprotein [Mobilicoccus caccae]
MSRNLTLATAALSALALTACGGQDGSPTPGQNPPAQTPTAIVHSDPVPHNDADTMFTQMMIVHHQGAIEMSQLAPQRAESQEVKDLAATIEQAQGPEIEQMTTWLQAWGEPVESSDHGHEHDESMLMNGKTHQQVMAELRGMSGKEFDRAFLKAMIPHHEGAVTMSQDVLRGGQNPDVQALAQQIIDSQEAEITQMKDMLADM